VDKKSDQIVEEVGVETVTTEAQDGIVVNHEVHVAKQQRI
jgi:hypothetical protein